MYLVIQSNEAEPLPRALPPLPRTIPGGCSVAWGVIDDGSTVDSAGPAWCKRC